MDVLGKNKCMINTEWLNLLLPSLPGVIASQWNATQRMSFYDLQYKCIMKMLTCENMKSKSNKLQKSEMTFWYLHYSLRIVTKSLCKCTHSIIINLAIHALCLSPGQQLKVNFLQSLQIGFICFWFSRCVSPELCSTQLAEFVISLALDMVVIYWGLKLLATTDGSSLNNVCNGRTVLSILWRWLPVNWRRAWQGAYISVVVSEESWNLVTPLFSKI